MMNASDQIKSYLGGTMSLRSFIALAMKDSELEHYLEQDVSVPPYTKDGSAFLYVISQNPNQAASDLNVRDLLSRFLTVMGVPHRVDQTGAQLHGIALDAAPTWLRLPDQYVEQLIGHIAALPHRAARLKAAKEQIARDFRYLKKPPRWLQDAMWPLVEGSPLVFIGQLGMDDLLHDEAQLYAFADEQGGSVTTIVQTA